jgi:hypothetical protein
MRRRAADLGFEWLFGEVVLDAIHLLGPADPETPTLAAEARAIYERIGDNAHLARLDEALEGADDSHRRAGRATPAVTTTSVRS